MANLEKIEKFLKIQKIPYKIIDLGGETFRVEDVVKVGIVREAILKTLLIRCQKDTIKGMQTIFVAIGLRGGDKLDFKKVRKLFGGRAELATPAEVLKIVGVPIGAVCPIEIGVAVYFDRRAMELGNVNMGSGDLTKGLDMKFTDLLKTISGYEVTDLVQR